MHHLTLPGRASLFVAATLTFIATVSLLAPPAARAAAPLRGLDAPAGAGQIWPCARPATADRTPRLHFARTR